MLICDFEALSSAASLKGGTLKGGRVVHLEFSAHGQFIACLPVQFADFAIAAADIQWRRKSRLSIDPACTIPARLTAYGGSRVDSVVPVTIYDSKDYGPGIGILSHELTREFNRIDAIMTYC